MTSLAVLWAQYGPYHLARAAALQRHARPARAHALELASRSRDYAWDRGEPEVAVTSLCANAKAEELAFLTVFRAVRRHLRRLKVEVCLLPSYSPRPSLAAFLAAKSLSIRTVLMSESHAGTARAGPLGTWVKRRLVGGFDAALVGGGPQKRYLAALGMPATRIFAGYDAVDNGFFARGAEQVRGQADQVRARYDLPERYVLSLGRFVAKKNLDTLIQGYAASRRVAGRSAALGATAQHLVLVGSGEEERHLRARCTELHLPIYDKSGHSGRWLEGIPDGPARSARVSADGRPAPGVHFYGFRQIGENPVFYGLAEAFVLPSRSEEWGLVVNEAMACGLPVVASETAGCAEDLLVPGWPAGDGVSTSAFREAVERAGLVGRVRQNGFVFDPGSPAELALVLRVLAEGRAVAAVQGATGRRIIAAYDCEAFARGALAAAGAAVGARAVDGSCGTGHGHPAMRPVHMR